MHAFGFERAGDLGGVYTPSSHSRLLHWRSGPSCRRPSPRGRCAHRPDFRADDATQEDNTVSIAALAEARFGVLRSSCAGQI